MRRCAVLVLLFIALSSSLRAQTWQLSHAFGSAVTVVYFLETEGLPSTGFVGTAVGQVFRTTDGGNSWQQTSAVQLQGSISDFAFKDATTGFLSCRANGGRPGCFRTTDAGLTWTPLVPANDRFSVYYNKKYNRLFLSGFNNRMLSSNDDGVTWAVKGPDLNGVRFATDNFGVATCFSGHNAYTDDGGVTWMDGTNSAECWNPLAIAPRSDTVFVPTLFAISEAANRVMVSKDGGNLWATLGSLPGAKPTGDIRGTCQQLYVQSDSGLFYSNDEGHSWRPLNGPGNISDSRFFVTGGSTNSPRIFAGDYFGRLYSLRDELRPPSARLNLYGATSVISLRNCKPIDDSILVSSGIFCDVAHLDSVTARSTSGITVKLTKPLSAKAGRFLGYDTLWLHYAPIGLDDSAVLTYHYHVSDYAYDSTIVVRGRRSASVELSAASDVRMVVTTSCRTARSTLTILNGRCDSVTIDSVFALDDVRFRIRGLTLPITLPPFEHLDVPVEASGEAQDTFYTTIRVVGELLGQTSSLDIRAELIVQHEGPVAISLPRTVTVQPTNICNTRLASVILTNTGCSDVICDTARWIIGSADLTVTHEPTYPRVLHPDDRDSISMIYHPGRAGTETAMLSWRLHPAKGPTIDTFVLIKLSSYSLSRATASVENIQFDSLRICDSRDTTFYVRNESCTSTEITSSTAPSDRSFIANVPTRTWLAPGDSAAIVVHLLPLAAGVHSSQLSVFFLDSNGSEQAIDIPLQADILPAVRNYALSPNTIDWLALDPCSSHDTTVVLYNLGTCDTLTLDSLWESGSPWFAATVPGIRRLAPGDSLSIAVHLSTSDDPSALSSLTLRIDGTDTTLLLSASTRSTGARFSLTPVDDTDFPAKFCTTTSRRFLVRNRTCNDVTVDDLSLSDGSFAMYPAPQLPLHLQAGAMDTLEILFSATDTDAHRAELLAKSGEETSQLGLHGQATTRPRLLALGAFATGTTTVLPDELTEVEIRALSDVHDSLELQRIDAHVAFDADMFRVISIASASNWRLTSSTDAAGAHLQFDRPSGGATIAAGLPLARVKLLARLSLHQSTPFIVDRLSLNDDDAAYRTCVLAPLEGLAAGVSTKLSCGDSLILAELAGLPITIERMTVSASGNMTHVSVVIRAKLEAAVEISIVDVGGRSIARSNKHVMPGMTPYSIESALGAGNYELVLSANGRDFARPFTVLH